MGKSTTKNPVVTHPVASPAIRSPRAILPRDEANNFGDPDHSELAHPQDTICSSCGAVYHNQHWIFDQKRRDLLLNSGSPNQVTCPGCIKIAERNPEGILTLRGDYWQQHRDEILNLIRNEETRGMETNPLARIMDIRDEGDTLVVETTNAKLTEKMGRRLDKAHNGSVHYDWPDNRQFVRVDWERWTDGNDPHNGKERPHGKHGGPGNK